MRLRHLAVAALLSIVAAFGAYAYTQPLGGSIFPYVGVTQPVTNLLDAYNEMLQLINAQAVGNASGTATDLIMSGDALTSTSTLTKTSNTTLAAIPGLTATVTAGGTYNFHIHLTGVAGASGGIKVAIGGTATATSSTATCWNYNGTTINAVTTQTTLGSSMDATTAIYTDEVCDGSIVVNAGGTLILEAAQNASNGTSTTVLVGSSFDLRRGS